MWKWRESDQSSGERSEASRLATVNCSSSLNKWKNADAWITEIRPWRGVNEVSVFRSGMGSVGI